MQSEEGEATGSGGRLAPSEGSGGEGGRAETTRAVEPGFAGLAVATGEATNAVARGEGTDGEGTRIVGASVEGAEFVAWAVG